MFLVICISVVLLAQYAIASTATTHMKYAQHSQTRIIPDLKNTVADQLGSGRAYRHQEFQNYNDEMRNEVNQSHGPGLGAILKGVGMVLVGGFVIYHATHAAAALFLLP